MWQSLGFHIIPNHYYYPVPDTDDLREKQPWDDDYPTEGIELREEEQLKLLDDFKQYFSECSFSGTEMFPHADGAVLYAMVRKFKPDKIIEVGSGVSTRLSLIASTQNKKQTGDTTEIIAIEPYPDESLRELNRTRENLTLIETKAEELDAENYLQLKEGDFLFIDSSHTLNIGNDVAHLYLRILPQLPKGVYVHCHDIFFPSEYPKEWILDSHRFWTEQYLLQTFLMFNDSFDVVWSGHHMYDEYRDKFEKALPKAERCGGSFWIKRVD
ncbi:class I SAM-dependent methyltransferase [Haladaptatus sp. DFWS20]|uniref:class I SAM-dependent methyltransferase n=1 Tax=Haladaptatus sp. DFWS20 TaxID=3403467 RepID=UPI003EB8C904